MSSPNDITDLLVDWNNGDELALEKLLPLVERELHRLAHSYMRRENPDHTLQTTAQIMRRILLNYARDQNRQKRGGRAIHVSLSEAVVMPAEKDRELISLNDAL